MLDLEQNNETIQKIQEIDEKLKEENSKEVSDGNITTKLMFEQMLRGLYLNTMV